LNLKKRERSGGPPPDALAASDLGFGFCILQILVFFAFFPLSLFFEKKKI
jgi:hypothetical protein